MKKLFALLMALTMTFQLVTPAWADTAEEHTHENTSTVEETTEAPTEETAAPTEETAAPTEEAPAEETTVSTEETTAPAEVEPVDEPAEPAAAKVRVTFVCTPEDLTLVVYPADGDVDQAVEAEEDGTYLLEPGKYAYFAAAEGYEASEGVFTVEENAAKTVEVTLAASEETDEPETFVNDVADSGTWGTSFSWTLTTDGTLTVSGKGKLENIRLSQYSKCDDIIKVVIKSGVTGIGTNTFGALSNLQSVSLPTGVTSIDDYAFGNCYELSTINIPSGVKSIGANAFSESALTQIVIPSSVTSIGDYAFRGCEKLASVSLSAQLSTLGEGAFLECKSLSGISIPEKVSSIARETFSGCTALADVTLGQAVSNIGERAFSGCTALLSVEVTGTASASGSAVGETSIGSEAFSGCTKLKSVSIPASVTSIEGNAFSDCRALASVDIPEGVTSIGGYAFSGCSSLASVTIPAKVTAIGEWAFSGCTSLTSVTIPDGVTTIEERTFGGCSSLTKVSIPESVTQIRVYAFFSAGLTDVYYAGSEAEWNKIAIENYNDSLKNAAIHCEKGHTHSLVQVPAAAPTCTESGCGAYYTCQGCGKRFADAQGQTELAEVPTIPALGHTMVRTEAKAPTAAETGNNEYYTCSTCHKVFKDEAGTQKTTVEDETLEKLSSIASGKFGKDDCLSWALTADGTLTISGSGRMPDYSDSSVAPWYSNRTKITAAVVKSGVTNIGNYAFYACLKLAAIDLPERLTSIGWNAFQDCAKLKSVEIPESVTSIGEYIFSGCSSLTSVSIPGSVTSIDRYTFKGCSSLTRVSIPAGVMSIGQAAFNGCSSLTSVSIPEGVTSIGKFAFKGCSSLTSVSIPGSVTSIGDTAFYGCSNLVSVSIPEGVASIDNSAFSGCSSLTSVSIPEGVTSIGGYAFSDCSSLTSVSIPEGVTSIGDSAFRGCSSLTSVSIPAGVTSIGTYAFSGCSSLTSVSIPEGVTSIGGATFSGCSSLTSVSIPEGVTSIGSSAFSGCSSLTSVSIPEGVTSIGGSTFSGCSNLISVSIPDSVTSIGSNAFYGCSSLTSVSIPDGVTSIGSFAFYGCSSLTSVRIPDGVTSIGQSAFSGCSGLTSVRIPDGVTSIGEWTFNGCSSLTSVSIPDGVTSIGEWAFRSCSGLTTVGIPASVMSIEDFAFCNCSNIQTVYYGGSEAEWKNIDIGSDNYYLTRAEFIYGRTHECTLTHLPEKAPTCTENGNHEYYYCPICKKASKDAEGTQLTTVEAETLPALGHSMEKHEETTATCTTLGNHTYYFCTTCKKAFLDAAGKRETTVKDQTVDALGHAMVLHDTQAAACGKPGNAKYYTCRICGNSYKDYQGTQATTPEAETIPALAHLMVKTEAKAPTCTESSNNTYYTCATCQKVFKDQQGKQETTVKAETIPALGHTMVKTEAVAPTCTESGTNAYYTCKTCRKVFKDEMGREETTVKDETLAALGHTMTKTEAVAPTCTESGNNVYYTCATCHKVFKDEQGEKETTAEAEVLNALGHTMEKTEAVAPTHTAGGNNAYYTCRTCGKVFQDAQGTRETTPEQEQLPRLPGIADGKCGSLTWLLSDEGVLTVSGKGRMPDYSGSALAPWYDYRNQITALEVEDGVTSIGSYAFFDCTGLTSVSLPESLTKLGRSCFSGCDSLELLDISGLPKELTQKVTDLSGIAKLSEMVSRRVGSSAVYTWALEDSKSAPARLAGSELTVLRSGAFRLVCTEEYTGLTASAEVSVQTATVIRPEEREQLTGGDSLTLSVWAMPFETELKARWSLDEASEAYASITEDGVLTAKAVTEPVQITVRAVPTAGEDNAEKTLWILPKTTAIGILADGHLVGDSLTIELTEKTGLTLTAQIQPQGAKAEVLWSSSRTDVAEIDQDGTVRFLKPGTTVIRAESQDGSGIAAELTLKGQYLDGAETLTLTSDMEEAGLEVGRTAKLTLSGENAIDPANVEFYVAQGTAATVDDQGLVTAGDVPGTVTIVAALKNDPLLRRAELTLQVVPTLVRALRLNAEVSQEWGYFEELDGEYSLYAEISEVAGKNRSFRLTALGSDYRDNWSEVTNLTFETSDPAVVKVSDNGTVTLTAAAAGVCTVTVRCSDSLRAETRLRIIIQDRSPRLETSRLTLNSNLIAGVSTGLVDGGGNTVQSVTVYDYNKTAKAYETEPSQMFAAEAEDGTLTLRSLGAQKNGTYNVKLAVSCLSGTYEFLMQVKVANSLPAVTVKQLSKFNLFYLDSTAQLSVTAKNAEVEKVELVGADSFRLDDSGEVSYAETFVPGDKAVTKGTLRITLAGYQVPVEKAFTVATVTTAPKLTTNPGSSAINLALAEPECRVSILTNGQALDLTGAEITETAAFAEMENAGSHLVFRLTENKGGTVSMTLRLPGWTQTVKLSHRITAENKMPTVKLGTAALKLNSVFTRQTASTAVSLSQGNMDLGTMTFAPTAKEGTAARAESEKIALGYDPETGALTAAIIDPDNVPKNGTYSYTFTAALADGTELKGGTVRVSVASTTPRVKLSAASVKLNRYLAGREQAVVTASMTGGTGYRLIGFEGMPAYMSFDPGTGRLTVTLPDADLTADTCTLLPVIADETTGQEATLNTKLTFKVQTMYSDKLTLSLTAKGKLDATKPESVLTYTVNRVNNCLGAVDNVFLEGENADMFQAELDTDGAKPIVTLRTVPGQVYATNKAYKLQFRFSVCGAEVMSNVLTVKVSQTALKVTVPRTTTFYLSQTAALRCDLTSNVPMESVSLNAKTSKEFLEALGGEENLRFDGTRLEFHIVNPGALKAGKTYTVQLDITPENRAENVKPTLVKLTVKVMK